MNKLCILALAVLAGAAPALLAQRETPLDVEVRAAYGTVEKAREAMAGEVEDEERRGLMESYRRACLDFVGRYEGRADSLTVGRYDLARAYVDLQEPAKAAKHLEAFLSAAPTHAEADRARLFLGDCYRSMSRLEDARKLYADFAARSKNAELLPFAKLGLATSLYLDLRFDEAIAAYGAVMKEFPEHQVAGDAAFQLTDALVNGGKYEEARRHLATLLEEAKDAPELLERQKILALLGQPFRELEGVKRWIGAEDSSIERQGGRVVVLCFFMNNNIPSTQVLQFLSELDRSTTGQPVTFWGVTKAYKAGRHPDWSLDTEAKWLKRYRADPRFVLQRELRAAPKSEEEEFWKDLEKPITIPIALAEGFENHRAYEVRGVPCVVVIDRAGKIRMIEQGGQPVGGFQTRLISQTVRRLAAE
ncbi:MAG: tetratricopeptide repeat protein [Planctomycetota bacterium]